MSSIPHTPDSESDSEIYVKPGNVEIVHGRHPLDFEGQAFDRGMLPMYESRHSSSPGGRHVVENRDEPSLVCSARDRAEAINYNVLPRRYFPTDDEINRIRRNLFNDEREVVGIMSLPERIRNRSLLGRPTASTQLTSPTCISSMGPIRTRSETITITSYSRPVIAVCECSRLDQNVLSKQTSSEGFLLINAKRNESPSLRETLCPSPLHLLRPGVTMQSPAVDFRQSVSKEYENYRQHLNPPPNIHSKQT